MGLQWCGGRNPRVSMRVDQRSKMREESKVVGRTTNRNRFQKNILQKSCGRVVVVVHSTVITTYTCIRAASTSLSHPLNRSHSPAGIPPQAYPGRRCTHPRARQAQVSPVSQSFFPSPRSPPRPTRTRPIHPDGTCRSQG